MFVIMSADKPSGGPGGAGGSGGGGGQKERKRKEFIVDLSKYLDKNNLSEVCRRERSVKDFEGV